MIVQYNVEYLNKSQNPEFLTVKSDNKIFFLKQESTYKKSDFSDKIRKVIQFNLIVYYNVEYNAEPESGISDC